MTTYTAITGAEIDTDSPITESLMTRLRDNPIAITEGSAGAPLIQLAAMGANSVGASQIVANSVNFASKIDSTVSDTTLSVSVAGTVIPAGVWNVQSGSKIEIYCGSAGWQIMGGLTGAHQIISDGASVRLKDGSAYSTPARRIFT